MASPARAPVVLCAVDFTECSVLALRHALRLCSLDASTIHVLHVCEAPDVRPGSIVKGLNVDAPTRLRELVDEALKEHEGAEHDRVHLLVRNGAHTAAVISQAAKQLSVDLIVVATHGRRGFQRLLVGSVAEELVRIAPCSVMVIREKHT